MTLTNKKSQQSFSYSFKTPKTAEQVFKILLDVKQWWSGLYEETITGKSQQPGDTFTFEAGGGAHYTEQKLTELVPHKSVAWLITKANLNFVEDPKEWEGTTIRFQLSPAGQGTEVTFTHEGLVQDFECYEACSSAWMGYLDKLKNKVQ